MEFYMKYSTQMEAARNGEITGEMKLVAEKEGISPESLRSLVAEGKAIIPCNKNHRCISPNGVGASLRTKINVNLGTSRDMKDMDSELAKVKALSTWARRRLWISALSATQENSGRS